MSGTQKQIAWANDIIQQIDGQMERALVVAESAPTDKSRERRTATVLTGLTIWNAIKTVASAHGIIERFRDVDYSQFGPLNLNGLRGHAICIANFTSHHENGADLSPLKTLLEVK